MKLVVSIPTGSIYTFESQVHQYPEHGPKGVSYFAGVMPDITVDCLLFRSKSGRLRGILNHYPKTVELEQQGNVNIFIDPRYQRQGIATALMHEAERRWRIDWEQQRYTEAGAHFAQAYIAAKPFPPFERATEVTGVMTVEQLAAHLDISLQEAQQQLDDLKKDVVWVNPLYIVHRRDYGPMVHLSIRRQDNEAVHDWREFQEIKNHLVGPRNEGIELYPSEDRLVDTANQYHLWVWTDPEFRIDLGFKQRKVIDKAPTGGNQRPRSAAS